MPLPRPITIQGKYTLTPNPCTSKPCLPGMVYALEADGIYFPTIAQELLVSTHTWHHFTPQPGEDVMITGTLHTRHDILGNIISTIEVLGIQPVRIIAVQPER